MCCTLILLPIVCCTLILFVKIQLRRVYNITSKAMSGSRNTKNTLLIKDEEGKVKQTTYNLPGETHTYGKKVVDDPEPIKYVVNGWKDSSGSQAPQPKDKNFQQMNKLSLQSGALTAKDQQQFRKTTNVMIQNKVGKKEMPILLPEEDFTYGVANRPSTPVKLVVGNCYGLQKEGENHEKYMRETLQKEQQKGKKLHAAKTKAQILREQKAQEEKQYRQKPNIDAQFKLSKFSSNPSTKVDTRLGAFKPQSTAEQKV